MKLNNYYNLNNDDFVKFKKTKIIFYIIFGMFFSTLFVLFVHNNVFASTPKIVNKLSDAFSNIEEWILKLSTPAAAVAVGVGIFMKKFSFGDEERMRTAKKVIRGSLVGYAVLLAIDLILAAIKSLIG